ncbi:MAG TPA: hypothetical protein VFW33_20075, partial [Gemmataceae bacterium]|nr:hypothetical protein [Gemmataceae bacterium]
EWIADHAHEWDAVIDPYSWAYYHSGGVFREGQVPSPPAGERKVAYVVLEKSGRDHPRLKDEQTARDMARSGRQVWEWTGQRSKEVVEVLVYEVPLNEAH